MWKAQGFLSRCVDENVFVGEVEGVWVIFSDQPRPLIIIKSFTVYGFDLALEEFNSHDALASCYLFLLQNSSILIINPQRLSSGIVYPPKYFALPSV